MNKSANYFIEKLNLQKHPEGGYFKEIYRSKEIIKPNALPPYFDGNRNISTSIYFLLKSEDFSSFHKIKSDEIWHFYQGSPLTIFLIINGKIVKLLLGNNLDNGESFQQIVPKNSWFAACVNCPNSFSLIGCTVAPGFNFNDFEIAKRKELLSNYPSLHEKINKLTKK
ncbi:MAG: cupin domain-containing protein [Bacteroidales bacterium]|nr:cupin domain-containing protein [Bacteroidales bacterium]